MQAGRPRGGPEAARVSSASSEVGGNVTSSGSEGAVLDAPRCIESWEASRGDPRQFGAGFREGRGKDQPHLLGAERNCREQGGTGGKKWGWLGTRSKHDCHAGSRREEREGILVADSAPPLESAPYPKILSAGGRVLPGVESGGWPAMERLRPAACHEQPRCRCKMQCAQMGTPLPSHSTSHHPRLRLTCGPVVDDVAR